MVSQKQILATSSIYLPIALKFAIVIGLIETPILFYEVVSYKIVLPTGWFLVFFYTIFRTWQLHTNYLFSDDVGLLKLIGGVVLIGLTSAALFGASVAMNSPLANDPVWLIKAAFICNPIAAVNAAAVATVGAALVKRAIDLITSQKL